MPGRSDVALTKEGSLKIAAKKCGLALDEYMARIESGEKRCTKCKQWKSTGEFNADSTRHDNLCPSCRDCQNKRGRDSYTPKPNISRMGKRVNPRDGDKVQARAWANLLVKNGKLPHPNEVPCTDCGHIYDRTRRHEYDHHRGYAVEHHGDVEAVCTKCHHQRERERNGG